MCSRAQLQNKQLECLLVKHENRRTEDRISERHVSGKRSIGIQYVHDGYFCLYYICSISFFPLFFMVRRQLFARAKGKKMYTIKWKGGIGPLKLLAMLRICFVVICLFFVGVWYDLPVYRPENGLKIAVCCFTF